LLATGGFNLKVYVLNQKNQPLMPCTPVVARLLLKEGKAKCIRKAPFVIKLLVDSTEHKQQVIAGMDTGSKSIGAAAVANGEVVYQSEIQIRNDISKKMQQRATYRRTRRNRKTRHRKARFLNRASSIRHGRLAPSIKSKINSHLREKKFVESILPVSNWKVETASFDIHKISNPTVKSSGYQNGPQKDFYNAKAYVLHRDKYKCQKCKTTKGKLHVHHIVFKSKGGTDAPDNLITLCESCHKELHEQGFEIKGKKNKTKHATEMGIIKSQLKKQFGAFEEVFGYETKFKREQILQMPKTHFFDAVAICLEDGEIVNFSSVVYYKKHVASGDYQQTKGARSEKKMPTGKLFGFRKFDKVKTPKGVGFIKGKRSTGYFAIDKLNGEVISNSLNIKKKCSRLSARTTTLIERKMAHSSTGQAHAVSCA
jgi:5-methylcytosine-specific restriction endonuclease McrA